MNEKMDMELDAKMKRRLTSIQIVGTVTEILIAIGIIGAISKLYPNHFLALYMGEYAKAPLFALFIMLLPLMIEIILFIMYQRGIIRVKKRDIIITIVMLIATFVLLGTSFIMQYILPPFASVTQNEKNYLVLDKELLEYEDDVYSLFPENIPETATEVSYEYMKYEAFFSQDFTIVASWNLPKQEYAAVKAQMQKQAEENGIQMVEYINAENQDSGEKVYKLKPQLVFGYDDETYRVEYRIQHERTF